VKKRLAAFLLVGALAGGVVGANVTASQATDPIARLQRQVRVLQGKVANLQREVFQCEQTVNLTEYNDFVSTSGGSTWALDYTATGDAVDDRFVVETC
jgi:hypothetical protein